MDSNFTSFPSIASNGTLRLRIRKNAMSGCRLLNRKSSDRCKETKARSQNRRVPVTWRCWYKTSELKCQEMVSASTVIHRVRTGERKRVAEIVFLTFYSTRVGKSQFGNSLLHRMLRSSSQFGITHFESSLVVAWRVAAGTYRGDVVSGKQLSKLGVGE